MPDSSYKALLYGSLAVVGQDSTSWAAKMAAKAISDAAEAKKRQDAFYLGLRRLIENGDLCRNCEDMIATLRSMKHEA
jgi:hypothetical protein